MKWIDENFLRSEERGMIMRAKDLENMKHFRKWAEDKNPFMAAIALQITDFSEDCYDIFESIRKEKRIEGEIPLPSLKRWLKLYNNPKKIIRVLLKVIGSTDESSKRVTDSIRELMNDAEEIQTVKDINEIFAKMTPAERKYVIDNGHEIGVAFLESTIQGIADLRKEPTKNRNMAVSDIARMPEIIFVMRVMAPCFNLYGIYPVDLLKMAQNGDDDALEKLLRLDKSAIFDPRIAEIVHQAQAEKKRERIYRIKKAFNSSSLVRKTDMKSIKCNLAGMISFYSLETNQKIQAIEILRLYDALARDKGIDMIDPDLADMSPESFEKAIQRARKFWGKIFKVDKK